MDGISTATVLGQVSSQLSEGSNTFQILFGPQSISTTSHTFTVFDTPVVIKAYGLSDQQLVPETVTLQMVVQIGTAFFSQDVIVNGKTVVLDATNNNNLVVDLPGTYRCVLSGGLGTVAVTQQKTSLSYYSYGMSSFALAT